jgi:hypothetical protein
MVLLHLELMKETWNRRRCAARAETIEFPEASLSHRRIPLVMTGHRWAILLPFFAFY